MKCLRTVMILMLVVMMAMPTSIMAQDDIHEIVLQSSENSDGTYSFSASVDGVNVNEYDYVWNIDPTTKHDDVKNSPAEYYTGNKPADDDLIYIAHDIKYYPTLDANKYVKGQYGDDVEWLYYYEIEEYKDYIFATLPVQNNSVPTEMMHTAQEAYNNAVLHINQAGTYRLSGNWHGQVLIDLGEDSFDDESAVVTLILNGVDIECSVASGICFYQVYECDNAWEDREDAISEIDTSKAGANIVIADGSQNNVSGTNIYRILKTKYKDENSTATIKEQKKSYKIDGALYSFMSLNIDGQDKGTGILNINAGFEGLDTELHLTINGGHINISSGNDGINVNEDNVSIFTMNGGYLQILAGLDAEGDGIDSNGYLNINGGTIISSAKPQSDSGLDSDKGTIIDGGTVIAFGSSMDVVDEYSEDGNNVTMNLVFSSNQNVTTPLVFTDEKGNGIFGFDLSDNELFKDANRTYQCLIVSAPNFTVGNNYNVYLASSISGTDEDGIYTTVKKFTSTSQLAYSSTGNIRGGFGNIPSDFNPFDNQQQQNNAGGDNEVEFDPNNQGQNQTGDFGGRGGMPNDGNTQPTMPNGNTQPTMPNEGANTGDAANNMPTGSLNNQTGQQNTTFTVTDKVNTFSGVSVYASGSTANNGIALTTVQYFGSIVAALLVGVVIGCLATALIITRKKEKTSFEQ